MPYDHSGAGSTWLPRPFQKLDPIHKAIRKAITAYQYSSFRTFAFKLSFSPYDMRSDANGLVRKHPRAFLFEAEGKPPLKLLVRVEDGGDVLVKLSRSGYVPIAEYFRLLPIVSDPSHWSLDFQLEHQSQWWLANGRHFAFLELPAECRELIYGFSVGPVLEPYPISTRFRSRRGATKINKALLFANKQIYAELKHLVYHQTPFYLQYSRLFHRIVSNSHFPLSQLRFLDLAFSHASYLKFFGCHLCDSYDDYDVFFTPDPQASIIGKLELKQLTLFMPSPADLIDIPWTNGCQKIMVDWILDSAWPFVKGQPVVVTGFIKEAQKLDFDAKAMIEWKRRQQWEAMRKAMGLEYGDSEDGTDEENGGVRIDGANITDTMRADVEINTKATYIPEDGAQRPPASGGGSVNLPPVCECEKLCQKLESWWAIV